MEVGYRGFAVPWAVFVDYENRFWLNGNYSIYPKPGDRVRMKVAHTSSGYPAALRGPGR